MTILETINPIQSGVTSLASATLGSIPTLFIPMGIHLTITRPDLLFCFQIGAWSIAIISGICTIINYIRRWTKEKNQ